jgi:hypothetical protein
MLHRSIRSRVTEFDIEITDATDASRRYATRLAAPRFATHATVRAELTRFKKVLVQNGIS